MAVRKVYLNIRFHSVHPVCEAAALHVCRYAVSFEEVPPHGQNQTNTEEGRRKKDSVKE